MEQRRLLRDSLFNLSSSVLSAVLGLVTVPLFVSRVPTHSYADWLVTLATAKSVIIVDFGVGWTIVRLISAEAGALGAESRQYLRSAATFLTGLALVSGAVTFIGGWIELGNLQGHRLAILGAGAVLSMMSHLNNYSVSVIWGRRRFDLAGILVTTEAALQSGGVIVILLAGGDIVAAAVWEATVVTIIALAKLVVAGMICSDATFRPSLRWPTAPIRLIRFGLASQISDGLSSLFWNLGVMILGQVASPIAVVGFSVAQKVPFALSGFVSRAAEVTMPAAGGLADKGAGAHATVAVSSARIAAALSIPVVITVWLVADPFLTLWVGTDMNLLAPTMRIAAATVAAHSLGESARYFLWGSGRVESVVAIQIAGTAILVLGAGALYLLAPIDSVSFAALQAASTAAMAVALALLTAARAGLSGLTYARRVTRGMPLAAIASAAIGIGVTLTWPSVSWLRLIAVASCITVTFMASMLAFGLNPKESVALRRLVRQT